jgi:hypothetical protein
MICSCRFNCVFVIAAILTSISFGQGPATTAYLLSPSKGQIPNDTGSDGQTKMTVEKVAELGGNALKVVFAEGDSFGDRTSRAKLAATRTRPFSDLQSLQTDGGTCLQHQPQANF